jgi:hypothetical protein
MPLDRGREGACPDGQQIFSTPACRKEGPRPGRAARDRAERRRHRRCARCRAGRVGSLNSPSASSLSLSLSLGQRDLIRHQDHGIVTGAIRHACADLHSQRRSVAPADTEPYPDGEPDAGADSDTQAVGKPDFRADSHRHRCAKPQTHQVTEGDAGPNPHNGSDPD